MRTSIFQRPVWVVVFALTAAIAWGWAFPLIKVGFTAFGITADMTGQQDALCRHPFCCGWPDSPVRCA